MIKIPEGFTGYQTKFFGKTAEQWLADLPGLLGSYLDRWQLTLDAGEPMHGMTALVVPVRMSDGTSAVIKLQQADGESDGEALGLRTWDGQGAVRVIADDGVILLLERLDSSRHLSAMPDPLQATQVIAELLLRLNAHQAPPEIRKLGDITSEMLSRVPETASKLPEAQGKLLKGWAAQVSEVAGQAGDRLLHWDLHFDNVLAAGREPWLAIDPKPLAGTSGFELLPALDNRWEEIVASGDVKRAVLQRFHLMTEVLGLDRDWATAWTLARVVQNLVWFVEDGEETIEPIQHAIATALTSR